MNYLPLRYLIDTDSHFVDKNLITLSKFHHLGFPVSEGLVVIAPVEKLKKLKKMHGNYFGQKAQEIEIFEDLKNELLKFKLDPDKVWNELVKRWIEEMELFNQAFSRPILFLRQIKAAGSGHYDKKRDVVNIKIDEGKLDVLKQKRLEELIRLAQSKLLLTQNFHWVLDSNEIKFVEISPFTGHEMLSNGQNKEGEFVKLLNLGRKNHIKIFIQQDGQLNFDKEGIDGILEARIDNETEEERIWRLVEIADAITPKPLLIWIKDIQDVEDLLFLRNKKRYLNISPIVPSPNNFAEFLETKRHLASRGISRKGSLKLWAEFSKAENLVNADEYAGAGMDGVIFNLDGCIFNLTGTDGTDSNSLKVLIKFLEIPVKIFNKAGIPILLFGKNFLVKETLSEYHNKGIFGVVLEAKNAREDWPGQFEFAHKLV